MGVGSVLGWDESGWNRKWLGWVAQGRGALWLCVLDWGGVHGLRATGSGEVRGGVVRGALGGQKNL